MKNTILILILIACVSFTYAIELINVDLYTPEIDDIELIEISTDEIDNAIKLRSQSNFLSNPNQNFGEDIDSWARLLSRYDSIEPIEFIAVDKSMRLISEISLPKNRAEYEQTYSNLRKFKRQGYNAVLLSFDGTEEIVKLKHFAKRVNKIGFDVYFTFGYYDVNPLVLPEAKQYTKILKGLAPLCKGFLLNWRRTSQHLFYPCQAWYNMNLTLLREANPQIIILGEVYYGNNIDSRGIYSIVTNLPPNISGAVVFNFGYNNMNIENIMTNYLPQIIGKDIPLIGVVISGDKATIENRFFSIGYGVITLSDTTCSPSSINNKQ